MIDLPDLSDIQLNTSDVCYRIVCAIAIMQHIRGRLNAGESYTPGMVPNIQSAIDALHVPLEFLIDAMEKAPPELVHLRPTPSDVAACAMTIGHPREAS